jgi:hypothetical protein
VLVGGQPNAFVVVERPLEPVSADRVAGSQKLQYVEPLAHGKIRATAFDHVDDNGAGIVLELDVVL